MTDPKPDRRSQQRTPVRLSVSVRSSNGSVQGTGHTRDLSTSGVFLYTDSSVAEGSQLEVVLVLPPELTFGEKSWVCCQGSVVRVERNSANGDFGVAAVIERFQILPEV